MIDANTLTRNIIEFLKSKNHFAERVNCFGTPYPLGDGLFRMKKTNMDKGTADVHAVVFGRSVKIEVKIGSDCLSSFQREYRRNVEKAGGVYYVASSFEEFTEWYDKLRKEAVQCQLKQEKDSFSTLVTWII